MPFRLLNRNGDLTVSALDLAAVSLYETLYCHSTSSQPYLVGDGDPSGKPIKMLKKGGRGERKGWALPSKDWPPIHRMD